MAVGGPDIPAGCFIAAFQFDPAELRRTNVLKIDRNRVRTALDQVLDIVLERGEFQLQRVLGAENGLSVIGKAKPDRFRRLLFQGQCRDLHSGGRLRRI